MLIFSENGRPTILDSLYAPLVSPNMWTLDLAIKDFVISDIKMLEATTCPALTIDVEGFQFDLPTNWFMLVYDAETTQLDTISIAELAGRDFTALVGSPSSYAPNGVLVSAVDYKPSVTHVSPSLSKHQMLCHPINEKFWINIAPSDAYSKFLKNCYVGDIY